MKAVLFGLLLLALSSHSLPTPMRSDVLIQKSETDATKVGNEEEFPSFGSIVSAVGNIASSVTNTIGGIANIANGISSAMGRPPLVSQVPGIPAGNAAVVLPPRIQFTGAANKISPVDTRCVMCQYFVQRIENEVVQYTTSPTVFSETESKIKEQLKSVSKKTSKKDGAAFTEMVEVEAKVTQIGSGGIVQGRYREGDVRSAMPNSERYSLTRSATPSAADQQDRVEYKQMFEAVFQDFQALCVNRMPQPFVAHCQSIMTNYDQIAEGLHYGDRPDSICMTLDYCSALSYAYNQPHSRYVDERPTNVPAVPQPLIV